MMVLRASYEKLVKFYFSRKWLSHPNCYDCPVTYFDQYEYMIIYNFSTNQKSSDVDCFYRG